MVAQITRTSTEIGVLPPRRLNVRRSSTPSSVAWSAARQLADLVEEHGASVGALEGADVLLLGAGERATLVTEQLGGRQRGEQ